MKRLLGSAAIIALSGLVLSSAFAPARADDTLDPQIKAVYDAKCTALKNADFDAFAKTMSTDYVTTDPDGKKQSRDEYVATVKAALDGLDITSCHFTLVKSVMSGNAATVSMVTTFDGSAQGAPLNVMVRATDTFEKTGEGWLENGATVAEQTVTVGGKVYQHIGTPATPAP